MQDSYLTLGESWVSARYGKVNVLILKYTERRRHTGDIRFVFSAIVVNVVLETKLFYYVAKPHIIPSQG